MNELHSQPQHLLERRLRLYDVADPNKELGLRPLNPKELSRVTGITADATNIVHLGITKDHLIALIKQYTDDPEKGQSQKQRATNESDTLEYLLNHPPKGVIIPKIIAPLAFDHYETPTLAMEYINGYTPLSAISPTIRAELVESGPATMIPIVISGVSALHSMGVVHKDFLFGENLGLISPKKKKIRCGIIDFELSEQTADMDARFQDLEALSSFLVAQMGPDKTEKGLEKLAAIFGNYDRRLVGLGNLDEQAFGKRVVEAGIARIEQMNAMLI